MRLNIVIPVYNEGERLLSLLQQLVGYLNSNDKLVVVEACDNSMGSSVCSHAIFQQYPDNVFYLASAKGRAVQMNVGAELLLSQSSDSSKTDLSLETEWLWFLHCDSGVSNDHFKYLRAMNKTQVWGRFDIQLVPEHKAFEQQANKSTRISPFSIISLFMNVRSRLTQVMTGDQGIFIRGDIFQQLNGYANIPLMEDVEISKRLRGLAKANCDGPILQTCARRWQQHGWVKTVLLMWQLRLMYWFGVSPNTLVKKYYG